MKVKYKIRKNLLVTPREQISPIFSFILPTIWLQQTRADKQDENGTCVPSVTGWLTRYIPGDVYTDGTQTKQPQQI